MFLHWKRLTWTLHLTVITSSIGTGCFVELTLAYCENVEVFSSFSLKITSTVTLLALVSNVWFFPVAWTLFVLLAPEEKHPATRKYTSGLWRCAELRLWLFFIKDNCCWSTRLGLATSILKTTGLNLPVSIATHSNCFCKMKAFWKLEGKLPNLNTCLQCGYIGRKEGFHTSKLL